MSESLFGGWENFYVIVGSSAAALTGLQFVVIALIHDVGGIGGGNEIAAFGTPTVLHFCVVLLVSALMSMPWDSTLSPALAIAIVGALGAVYTFITWRRASRSRAYKPVLEDWIWHVWVPLLAYLALVWAGFGIHPGHRYSFFLVAISSLMLLFDGIHNAWDTVTYVATELAPRRQRSESKEPPAPAP
jgi:hypothetical protein